MDISSIDPIVLSAAVIITGLVVVFVALIGLWALMAASGKIFSSMGKNKKSSISAPPPKVEEKTAPVQSEMIVEGGISDEVVAVISAAIASMDSSSGGLAVRSVKRAKPSRSVWMQAGVAQNTQPF